MKRTVLIIVLIFLVSCVNKIATKPTFSSNDSIVDLVEDYWKASEASLISFSSLKKPIPTEKGVKTLKLWWCLERDSSISELRGLVSNHCSSNGGIYRDSWCVTKVTDGPIYLAHIDRANTIERDTSPGVPYCSSGPRDIGVIISENLTAGQKDWNQYAKNKLGYLSNEDKKLLAAAYVKKSFEDFQKRKQQAQYMLENRGTRICKSGFLGFIEDSNNGKIKISIVAFSGFMYDFPKTIWDYPINWYICE